MVRQNNRLPDEFQQQLGELLEQANIRQKRTAAEEYQEILGAVAKPPKRGRKRVELPWHVKQAIERLLAQNYSSRAIARSLRDVYPVGRATIDRMILDGRLEVRNGSRQGRPR